MRQGFIDPATASGPGHRMAYGPTTSWSPRSRAPSPLSLKHEKRAEIPRPDLAMQSSEAGALPGLPRRLTQGAVNSRLRLGSAQLIRQRELPLWVQAVMWKHREIAVLAD